MTAYALALSWGVPQWAAIVLLAVKGGPTLWNLFVGGYQRKEEPVLERNLAAVVVWTLILAAGGFWS